MRLREPATRVHVRLEPLVAVWEVPLTARPWRWCVYMHRVQVLRHNCNWMRDTSA
jgi:hypothetical protein